MTASSASYFLPAPSGTSSSSGARVAPRGLRRWLEPSTRDYVVTGGHLKDDTGFASKAILALSTKLGSCQAFPSFGSRLHEIRTADERGRKLAERHALTALSHMTREIQNLGVTAAISKARPGAIDLVISGRRGNAVVSATYTAGL